MAQDTGQDSVQFLKAFLLNEKNDRLKSVLRFILTELRVGLARSSVFFSSVTASNANSCVSFSEATLDAEVLRDDLDLKINAPYVAFFVRGYAILAAFLDESNPRIPENKAECGAVEDLLMFLADTSGLSLLLENIENGKCVGELDMSLAVRMAQNLLVPLAPHKIFLIDDFPDPQLCWLTECCTVAQKMNVQNGDTSFGCRKGWYGRADILLKDDEIPVTFMESKFTVVESDRNETDNGNVSLSEDASVKVKKDEDFTPKDVSQILAQTIVNSFVRKGKSTSSHNTMVPGIGICQKRLIISLYDCVDDILVTTGPMELKSQIGRFKINLRTIIMLWLALNHNLFGNKTPERYTSYKTDFHHVVGPVQLKAYMNESEQPFTAMIMKEEKSSKFLHDVSEEASCYLVDPFEDITAHIPFISLK